jgi:ribosomal protein S18 acetylase RimI-like enzyme
LPSGLPKQRVKIKGKTLYMKKRPYLPADFEKIRRFLIDTYDPRGRNWLLDRWNFSRYGSQAFHQTSDQWSATLGLWVDGADRIQAVVHSEGENHGEVFFQLVGSDLSAQEWAALVQHAEDHLFVELDGKRHLQIRLDSTYDGLKKLLRERGYQKLSWEEERMSLVLSPGLNTLLPEGFSLHSGAEISPTEMGKAHARAFGYADDPRWGVPAGVRLFQNLGGAPDYTPELYFALKNHQSQIVSFCQLWIDEKNGYCVLEPVGTDPDYRGLGLGKAVIYQALGHGFALGCQRAYVGSGSDFYHSIGFRKHSSVEVWSKDWG